MQDTSLIAQINTYTSDISLLISILRECMESFSTLILQFRKLLIKHEKLTFFGRESSTGRES